MANVKILVTVEADCGIHEVDFPVHDHLSLTHEDINKLILTLHDYLDRPMLCDICGEGQN